MLENRTEEPIGPSLRLGLPPKSFTAVQARLKVP